MQIWFLEDEDSVGDMSGYDLYKKTHSTSSISSARRGGRRVRRVKHRHSIAKSNNINLRSTNNTTNVTARQRMPLGGGYGGMFNDPESTADSTGAASSLYEDNTLQGTIDGNSQSSSHNSQSTATSQASVSSMFSMASKMFRNKTFKRRNPYGSSVTSNGSGSSRGSRSTQPWQRSDHIFGNVYIHAASRFYINLPFRIRYFIQLFSIVGVFMLASLNYFIAMETNPISIKTLQQLGNEAEISHGSLQIGDNVWMEGGGGRVHQVPKLRVRKGIKDPMKFLHEDLRPNELMEIAKEKFRSSTRFHSKHFGDPALAEDHDGDGEVDEDEDCEQGEEGCKDSSGPFKYGWKSMPRQVYNDFSTGISDDSKTIQNPKNAAYFENKARKEGIKPVGGGGDLQHTDGDARPPPKGTVAYVLPITTCYAVNEEDKNDDSINYHPYSTNHPNDESSFRDFAMMLRAMIHANSYRNLASESVYDYKMVAILHPRAKKCRSATDDLFSVRDGTEGGQGNSVVGLEDDPSTKGMVDRSIVLQNLGYHVELQYPPIEIEDNAVESTNVCKSKGYQCKDLIRLYAYELEEYDAVVLVDYDTLILGPVDKAVDLIVDNSDGEGIDAVFSWEHVPSLMNPNARASVINLSFFVLRPSKATFKTLISRYQSAQFSEPRGWGDIGRGAFPGWMTTVGFLTYYYDEVANAAKMEVNHCIYGNTGEKLNDDNSILITNGGKVDCSTGIRDSQCMDCSKKSVDDVVVADLSYCRAPWECGDEADPGANGNGEQSDKLLSSKLCRKFEKTWFSGRLQMEDVHPQLEKGNGQMCIDGKYQPMQLNKPHVGYKPNFLQGHMSKLT